ncbi:MAG: PfkB family carbohydrate kinase, partial [Actinomycetota bacterium]
MARSLRAVSFGESVIDQYPDRRVVAGSPVHLAAQLVALGWHADLVTRVGDDTDGRSILDVLDRCGVGRSLVEVDGSLPTGAVTITLHDGDHSFLIHGPAAWDELHGPDELPAHEALCYGSLAGRSEVGRAALGRVLERSAARLKVFDVNLRPPDVLRPAIELGLEHAAVMKVSEAELGSLAELIGIPSSPGAFFETAARLEWLAVSRGAAGARLYGRGGAGVERAARPVDVVD